MPIILHQSQDIHILYKLGLIQKSYKTLARLDIHVVPLPKANVKCGTCTYSNQGTSYLYGPTADLLQYNCKYSFGKCKLTEPWYSPSRYYYWSLTIIEEFTI